MEKQEIQKEITELKSKTYLTRKQRRTMQKLEKKLEGRPVLNAARLRKIKQASIYVVVCISIIGIVGGILWYVTKIPKLPPIDMAGHIEQNPLSHILDKAMPEEVQKHMLEHADGDNAKGKGVIIQYNCKPKYLCEPGFVQKLSKIVKRYPKNVYLAPGNYDGKIILTRLGKREVLSIYDEKKIVDFINDK